MPAESPPASSSVSRAGADDPRIAAAVERSLDAVRRGGFVAYPTETVWGLGAAADAELAVARLIAWKGRGEQAPLAVLTPSLAAAEAFGCRPAAQARRLAEAFWPGPLMLVVPCEASWAPGVARADGALGLRCSAHPLAAALAEGLLATGLGPLTSTSLNRSGEPPAADLSAARALCAPPTAPAPGVSEHGVALDEPLLIEAAGHDAGGGAPSTVVDCTAPEPRILRVGAIESAAIEQVLARCR